MDCTTSKTRLLYRVDLDLFCKPILLPCEDPLTHQLIEHGLIQLPCRYLVHIREAERDIGFQKDELSYAVNQRFSSKNLQCEPAALPNDSIVSISCS